MTHSDRSGYTALPENLCNSMSYSKLESASSRGALLAMLLLLTPLISACSGTGVFSRIVHNGESVDDPGGTELTATASPADTELIHDQHVISRMKASFEFLP